MSSPVLQYLVFKAGKSGTLLLKVVKLLGRHVRLKEPF